MSEMHDNSLLAYYTEIRPELTPREHEVFNALVQLGPSTMHQVASFVGRPVNAVSGRFSALRRKEKIEDSGLDGLSPEGSKATIWRVRGPVQKEVVDYIDTIEA